MKEEEKEMGNRARKKGEKVMVKRKTYRKRCSGNPPINYISLARKG